MQSNPEAYKYIRYAKTNRAFSNVFLGLGIISFSYGVLSGISNAIEKEESSNLLAGSIAGIIVGGGLVAISIPLRNAYKKKARKAIDIYNEGLGTIGFKSYDIKVGVTRNGLGFTVLF